MIELHYLFKHSAFQLVSILAKTGILEHLIVSAANMRYIYHREKKLFIVKVSTFVLLVDNIRCLFTVKTSLTANKNCLIYCVEP